MSLLHSAMQTTEPAELMDDILSRFLARKTRHIYNSIIPSIITLTDSNFQWLQFVERIYYFLGRQTGKLQLLHRVERRIGLCVDEQNRSWCSSSRDNDPRDVTVECVSDLTDPYTINDKVYAIPW